MNILAISPQNGAIHSGLACVVASMKSAGYSVECVNLWLTPDYRIPKGRFDVVATGGLACHFEEVLGICRDAQEAGAIVILGGGLVTADPEFTKSQIPADYYVTGEGDSAIIRILDGIKSAAPLPKGFVQGEQIEDLDSLPFPDYEAFGFDKILDLTKGSDAFFSDVFDYPRPYPLIGSRSCPFRCTFCYSPLGKKYRQRSINSIISELELVIPKYKINIINIIDELFSYDEQRVTEFCSKLPKLFAKFDWDIKLLCQLRVDKLKEDMLDQLKAAGFFLVSFGFESGSEVVLKSMKKSITPQQVEQAIVMTSNRGLSLQGNFIFGDRAETLETAEETLSIWRRHTDVGIVLLYIWALPNSELYQYCISKGIISDKLAFYKTGLYSMRNMTGMPESDYLYLMGRINIESIIYNPVSIPSHATHQEITVACPHCREKHTYKNFTVYENCSYPNLFPTRPNLLFYYKAVYCRTCRKRYWAISRLAKAWFFLLKSLFSPSLYNIYRKAVRIFKKQ